MTDYYHLIQNFLIKDIIKIKYGVILFLILLIVVRYREYKKNQEVIKKLKKRIHIQRLKADDKSRRLRRYQRRCNHKSRVDGSSSENTEEEGDENDNNRNDNNNNNNNNNEEKREVEEELEVEEEEEEEVESSIEMIKRKNEVKRIRKNLYYHLMQDGISFMMEHLNPITVYMMIHPPESLSSSISSIDQNRDSNPPSKLDISTSTNKSKKKELSSSSPSNKHDHKQQNSLNSPNTLKNTGSGSGSGSTSTSKKNRYHDEHGPSSSYLLKTESNDSVSHRPQFHSHSHSHTHSHSHSNSHSKENSQKPSHHYKPQPQLLERNDSHSSISSGISNDSAASYSSFFSTESPHHLMEKDHYSGTSIIEGKQCQSPTQSPHHSRNSSHSRSGSRSHSNRTSNEPSLIAQRKINGSKSNNLSLLKSHSEDGLPSHSHAHAYAYAHVHTHQHSHHPSRSSSRSHSKQNSSSSLKISTSCLNPNPNSTATDLEHSTNGYSPYTSPVNVSSPLKISYSASQTNITSFSETASPTTITATTIIEGKSSSSSSKRNSDIPHSSSSTHNNTGKHSNFLGSISSIFSKSRSKFNNKNTKKRKKNYKFIYNEHI